VSAEVTPAFSEEQLVLGELDLPGGWRRIGRAPLRWWRAAWSREHAALTVLILLYVAWFSHLSLAMYYNRADPPFDLGIFDQGLWLLSHFHAPFVTVMGRDLFGDHTSFILLLVAPFYRLFPEPQGILVLQVIVIASAAIPIFLLAQRLLKSTVLSTVIAATFLLNPAVQQGNMEQFHPEAFEVLCVAWAIYAAYTKKAVLLGVMVVLILMVKEDAAVYVVPLGVWVALRRNLRWGAFITAGAVAWAAIANYVIIPAIMGPFALYAGRIPFGGWGGMFSTLLRHPGTFWSYLVGDGRPYYVWQMSFPFAWMFLIAPEMALIGVLALLENTLSTFPYMHQILYHYSMAIVPALCVGTAYAISRLKAVHWRQVAVGATLLCSVWSCVLWGLAPFSNANLSFGWPPGSPTANALDYLDSLIPPNAVVSAWYPLVSHLDHRVDIYMWPNPFSASNWGKINEEGKRLPQASTVEYILLPDPLNSTQNSNVLGAIRNYYSVVSERDGYALYKRSRP
jgi:uncharacterized membrane protein